MFERIKNIALYGGTDRESYNAVKGRIQENNSIMSLVFASVASILIGIMLMLSHTQEGFSGSRPVYIIGLILSLIQIILSLHSRKVPWLSYISVYVAISVFLLYGIAIATLTRPEEQTVTFMVLLIFVPLIFVDRPINIAVSLIFYIILFMIMAYRNKTGAVLSVDVTDAVIFGMLSIVSETVVNRAKIRGYVLDNKLHIMSETDQLTGLNNRNCYEMKLPVYDTLYQENICCIYIDVNGLHELNNTKGHKAGDEMLCYIADMVQKQFGVRDAYRVGGDEYVVFVMDTSEDEIKSKLQTLNDLITKRGYHAAVGYEYHKGKNLNINKLIVEAESKMYKDKDEYYKVNNRKSR
jgi:diguanylate cyclase (GGDEF)-like protein